MGRKIISFILISITILSVSVMPLSAVSSWAYPELENAAMYGVFPIEWFDVNTVNPIKSSDFNKILDSVAKKLGISEYNASLSNPTLTRGEVLSALFELLAGSQFAEKLGCDATADYVEYMQINGIVKGDGASLALDSSCTIEQAAMFAYRVTENAAKKLDIGSKGMLWKVSKRRNKVYIFAAEYTDGVAVFPLASDVMAAYEAADIVYLISDSYIKNGDEFAYQLANSAVLSNSERLASILGEDLYKKTCDYFESYGYLEDIIKDFKPWFLALLAEGLSAYNPSSPQLSVDSYFANKSASDGKDINVMLSLNEQTEVLDSMSNELQIYLLKKAIEPEKIAFDLLVESWKNGDINAYRQNLSKYTLVSEASLSYEYENAVITKRAEVYTEKIKEMLDAKASKIKNYFVIVDADVAEIIMENLQNEELFIEERDSLS